MAHCRDDRARQGAWVDVELYYRYLSVLSFFYCLFLFSFFSSSLSLFALLPLPPPLSSLPSHIAPASRLPLSSSYQPEGLAVGAVVAIASGLGVAASIQEIQGATGALIGVAISASLLPPAVNSGMCWWMSLVVHLDSPYYDARSKTAKEYFDFAVYSLTLTLMNIALVWGTCVVFFALKKLAAKTTSKKLKNLLSDAPEELLRSTTYGARRNGSLERGG